LKITRRSLSAAMPLATFGSHDRAASALRVRSRVTEAAGLVTFCTRIQVSMSRPTCSRSTAWAMR